jgi:tetratricopeptide (TPR) repeat protein
MHRRLVVTLTASVLVLASSAIAAAETSTSTGTPLLSAPPMALPGSTPRAADQDAATYERCMQLAHTDPEAAQRLAVGWQNRGGAHPAEHCLAVALIGLKKYKEAARRLEALAQAMVHAPAALRAGVLGQAAQAWLLAGDAGKAYAADSAALALDKGDLNLLIDRAEAAGEAGWFDKALVDLDSVLKADPSRIDALIYRASAYRQTGRLDQALADIEAVLKTAPDSASALLERGNIRIARDDLEGARQDWQRVAVLAPGSAEAGAASANLAKLVAVAKATQSRAPQGPPGH